MNQLNCLQCQHCQLLPETDFSRRGTPIYCGAINPINGEPTGAKPLNLEGCPMGEPSQRSGPGHLATPAAVSYLRHWWPQAQTNEERQAISTALRRSRFAINSLASRHNIPRHPQALTCGPMTNPRWFSLEQKQYLEQMYAQGFWPRQIAGIRGKEKQLACQENARVKRVLLREVAKRGRRRSWMSVENWLHRQSPAAKRQKARKSAAGYADTQKPLGTRKNGPGASNSAFVEVAANG